MQIDSNPCILIAAGGTGGHMFPAQALALQLQSKYPSHAIFFAGKGLDSNKFFQKDRFSFQTVTSSSLSAKKFFSSFYALYKGICQSLELLKKKRPVIVIGFGSFHAFPVLAAAVFCKTPIVLFESNAMPGLVNRFFSRFAKISAVQFSVAKQRMKGRCEEVSMPIWQAVQNKTPSLSDALAYFSLQEDRTTFLVFGGSQGARFINAVFADALYDIRSKKSLFQVIHLTGDKTIAKEMEEVYAKMGVVACVKSFEENMSFAFALADVAICRSGAATLSELVHFEVPSILIPYPHAKEQHQLKNALFLEEVGGAFCLEEKQVSTHNLLSLLEQFIYRPSTTSQTMKMALRECKEKKTGKELIDLIHLFIEKN